MQSVPFHIAYLLTRYECVIVPGLGAFLVSSSDIEKTSRDDIISPPQNFLVFNPEINHNDGLLANSIQKENESEFSQIEANQLIERYVKNISRSLEKGKKVQIPKVGTLFSKDNKKVFQPDKTLSCNAFYFGLGEFSLPSVEDLWQSKDLRGKKNKEVVWIPISRKLISYVGSVAAALLAMCIIPTPLNNGNDHFNPAYAQYASLISLSPQNTVNEVHQKSSKSETGIQTPVDESSYSYPYPDSYPDSETETQTLVDSDKMLSEAEIQALVDSLLKHSDPPVHTEDNSLTIHSEPLIQTQENSYSIHSDPQAQTSEHAHAIYSENKALLPPRSAYPANPPKTNTLHYYIVIASLSDQISAKESLAVLQAEGFKDAAILYSNGRYRIYTNRFKDNLEAEKFLAQFRNNNPRYKDSWVLKNP